ncbi:MAG: hypothetical protein ACKVRO_00240 [Micropepsaceae bacterium]
MVVKHRKSLKARAASAEKSALDDIERKHWPEIEKKLAASRAQVASGKVKKWNLDRVLAEVEKRRRSKQAAE